MKRSRRSAAGHRRYLDRLVPAGDGSDRELRAGLARRARGRLARVLARWHRLTPEARGASRLATAAAAHPDRELREAFLAGGALRAWIAEVEDALVVAEAARAARGAARDSKAWLRLMDRVADLGALAHLAPGGRLPRDFPGRAVRLAGAMLARSAERLPAIVVPFVPPSRRRVRLRLRFREDPDLGLACGEIVLHGTGVRIVRTRRGKRSTVLELRGSEVRVEGVAIACPTAGRTSACEPEVGALRVSSLEGTSTGPRDPAFERRLRLAMALLRDAWPEAALMVAARTWRVVPVDEWGTVSYSSPRRPGVSYVHRRGGPAVRLAEDLLHEATHQRLHEIEEVHELVASVPAESAPVFYSPWRREWRPLRGLLHAACTFTVGAGFFARVLRLSASPACRHRLPGSRRRWLARRLLEEKLSVGLALRLLNAAKRRGLLAPAGCHLVAAVAGEHRDLASSGRRARAFLRATPAGREVLAKVRGFATLLRARPVRWASKRG